MSLHLQHKGKCVAEKLSLTKNHIKKHRLDWQAAGFSGYLFIRQFIFCSNSADVLLLQGRNVFGRTQSEWCSVVGFFFSPLKCKLWPKETVLAPCLCWCHAVCRNITHSSPGHFTWSAWCLFFPPSLWRQPSREVTECQRSNPLHFYTLPECGREGNLLAENGIQFDDYLKKN